MKFVTYSGHARRDHCPHTLWLHLLFFLSLGLIRRLFLHCYLFLSLFFYYFKMARVQVSKNRWTILAMSKKSPEGVPQVRNQIQSVSRSKENKQKNLQLYFIVIRKDKGRKRERERRKERREGEGRKEERILYWKSKFQNKFKWRKGKGRES